MTESGTSGARDASTKEHAGERDERSPQSLDVERTYESDEDRVRMFVRLFTVAAASAA